MQEIKPLPETCFLCWIHILLFLLQLSHKCRIGVVIAQFTQNALLFKRIINQPGFKETEFLTRTVCMYKGALSEELTAIRDKKAAASSSLSENNSGLTSRLPPRCSYTLFMRLKDDGATYTRTGGGWALSITDIETYAASHGEADAPVSPTWRTRPDNGFTSRPSALQPVTNIFSNMTDTVCDFPDP